MLSIDQVNLVLASIVQDEEEFEIWFKKNGGETRHMKCLLVKPDFKNNQALVREDGKIKSFHRDCVYAIKVGQEPK